MRPYQPTRVRLLIPVLLLNAFLWGGCGKKIEMVADQTVPAASGEVSIKHDSNRNTRLAITVRHLARPELIRPGSTVYVVWAKPQDPSLPPQNLGALLLSDDLKGKLETVTPFADFDLWITPEVDPGAREPYEIAVMTAEVGP